MEIRTRKLVYIAHRVSGDVRGNVEATLRAIRWVNLTFADVTPFCPWLPDVLALDDSIHFQRSRGIENDKHTLPLCDEVWVFGPWLQSEGVKAEIILAVELRRVVRFFHDVPYTHLPLLGGWGRP